MQLFSSFLYYFIPFCIIHWSLKLDFASLLLIAAYLANSALHFVFFGSFSVAANTYVLINFLLTALWTICHSRNNAPKKSELFLYVLIVYYFTLLFQPFCRSIFYFCFPSVSYSSWYELTPLPLLVGLLIFLRSACRSFIRTLSDTSSQIGFLYPILIECFLFILTFSSDYLYDTFISRRSGHAVFYLIWVFLFLLLTMINIIMIHRTEEYKQKIKQRDEMNQTITAYSEQLQILHYSLDSFRHDYKNIMLTFSAFIQNKDIAGLSSYYHEVVTPYIEAATLADNLHQELSNVKPLELRSLLSTKFLAAQEIGIHIRIDISCPVTDLGMNSIDAARVLGVFLDNAINATADDPDSWISMKVCSEHHVLSILISNSVSSIHDKAHHNQPALVVSNHGYGLKNVAGILASYPHILWETQHSTYHYSQNLRICLSEENE